MIFISSQNWTSMFLLCFVLLLLFLFVVVVFCNQTRVRKTSLLKTCSWKAIWFPSLHLATLVSNLKMQIIVIFWCTREIALIWVNAPFSSAYWSSISIVFQGRAQILNNIYSFKMLIVEQTLNCQIVQWIIVVNYKFLSNQSLYSGTDLGGKVQR